MSWKPHDYIAIFFSVILGVGLLMITYSTRILDKSLTDDEEALLEAVVVGLVALISGYVGAKIQQKRDSDD